MYQDPWPQLHTPCNQPDQLSQAARLRDYTYSLMSKPVWQVRDLGTFSLPWTRMIFCLLMTPLCVSVSPYPWDPPFPQAYFHCSALSPWPHRLEILGPIAVCSCCPVPNLASRKDNLPLINNRSRIPVARFFAFWLFFMSFFETETRKLCWVTSRDVVGMHCPSTWEVL